MAATLAEETEMRPVAVLVGSGGRAFRGASVKARRPTWLGEERSLDNMSLEADKAGGRLSGGRLPPTLPSSLQLNSRSLSG